VKREGKPAYRFLEKFGLRPQAATVQKASAQANLRKEPYHGSLFDAFSRDISHIDNVGGTKPRTGSDPPPEPVSGTV
jgi:hypothetical protein